VLGRPGIDTRSRNWTYGHAKGGLKRESGNKTKDMRPRLDACDFDEVETKRTLERRNYCGEARGRNGGDRVLAVHSLGTPVTARTWSALPNSVQVLPTSIVV
jgi:hypothetical protein